MWFHLGLWVGALALTQWCTHWSEVYVIMACMLLWALIWRAWARYWPTAWVTLTLAMPWTYQAPGVAIADTRVYRGQAEVLDARLLQDSKGQIWASQRKLPLDALLWVDAQVMPWPSHPIPGGFDPRKVYQPRGAAGQIRIVALDSLGPVPSRSVRASSQWRNWLLAQPWPHDFKGLALALSIGDRRWLSKEWKRRFQEAGLAHVLALSGFHLGLVTLVFRATRRWMPLQLRPWWMLLGATSTWALVAMVGSASLIRAAVFLTVLQLLSLLPYRVHGMASMHLAASLIILWMPQLTHQLGLQLSVMAVMAIVGARIPKGKSWVAKVGSGMLVAWVAQAATLPRTLSIFHQMPAHFLWTNVLLVPLVMLIYPLLLVALMLDLLGWHIPIQDRVMTWASWPFDLGSGVWSHRHPDVMIQLVMAISALVLIWAVRARHWWQGVMASSAIAVAMMLSSPPAQSGQFAYRRGRGLAWGQFSDGYARIHATKGLSANDWVWQHAFRGYWESVAVDSIEVLAVPWAALDSLYVHYSVPASQGFHVIGAATVAPADTADGLGRSIAPRAALPDADP